MDRVPPLVLAALIFLSVPAMALPVGAPAATSSAFETSTPVYEFGSDYRSVDPIPTADLALPERLEFANGDSTASGFHRSSVEIGATVTVDKDRIDGRFADLRLETRLESAESEQERRTILRSAISDLETGLEELKAYEAEIHREFRDGDRSERSLLVELARIDAKAETIEGSAEHIGSLANDVSGISLAGDVRAITGETAVLRGPVRAHVNEVLAGERDPVRVSVTSSQNGVVLALIENGEYVREAYRNDNRNRSATGSYSSISEAADRATEAYPWTFEQSSSSGISGVGDGIFRITATHPQGSLVAYMDEGTDAVFRDHQTLGLSSIPVAQTANTTDDGLQLTVDRTYRSGPLLVTVVDSGTGEAVEGTVTIDDSVVGSTGADGTLWTVAPREDYSVTVERGNESVETTIDWAD